MPAYLPGEAPVWAEEANYNDKYAGTLYVTNRRLLFEHKVGVIRKRIGLDAEISLEEITSTSVEKGPWNWIVLVVAATNQRHRFLFKNKNPDVLAKRISELMAPQSATSERPAP
jgi:hypothetical protein